MNNFIVVVIQTSCIPCKCGESTSKYSHCYFNTVTCVTQLKYLTTTQ